VAVAEPVSDEIGARGITYPWASLVIDVTPSTVGIFRLAQTIGNELFDGPSAGTDTKAVVLQRVGQQFPDVRIYYIGRGLSKHLFSKGIASKDVDRSQGIVDADAVQMGLCANNLTRGPIVDEIVLQQCL